MSSPDYGIPEKVLRYEEFINDHLKRDLQNVHKDLDLAMTEMSEYLQLKNTIQTFLDVGIDKNGLKSQVDIGCNFYVQANASDVSNILVNIGCGCYVEVTLNEALLIIEKRLLLLNKKCDILKKRSATIKAHIKLVLHGIQELQTIK